jgi:hypothetical protein
MNARLIGVLVVVLSALSANASDVGAVETGRTRLGAEGIEAVSGLPESDVLGGRGSCRAILPRGNEGSAGASPSRFACVGLRPAPTEIAFADSAIDGPVAGPDAPLAGPAARSDTTPPVGDSLFQLGQTNGPPTPRRSGPRRSHYSSPGGFFRSPTGTLLKSVAFPGWGQWSNGKKQKAAIYFGIETYFLTKAMIWRHRTFDRQHEWENYDPADASGRLAAFDRFDSARNSRNYFYWLTGITAFISMFDAYADCYLLTLERTRNMGDDYWGGQTRFAPDDELRIVAQLRF